MIKRSYLKELMSFMGSFAKSRLTSPPLQAHPHLVLGLATL